MRLENNRAPHFGRGLVGTALLLVGVMAMNGAGAATTPAGKAGFDCSKASAADEVAVCSNPQLGQLDIEMARLYRLVRSCALMGGRAAYHDDQSDWLDKRKACGSNMACIKALYVDRINELTPDAKSASQQRAGGHCPDQDNG